MQRTDIRLGLPSKGRLEIASLDFLERCGLRVVKPNPRQYQASLPAVPALNVLFQRPGDIVAGVRSGSLDFGITGLDSIHEHGGENGAVVTLHDALGFGQCSLELAVPEEWAAVQNMAGLAQHAAHTGRALRVATKYPLLTGAFLRAHGLPACELISAEGTLEVAPSIGYADLIADLVASGLTLHDNRLRALPDGCILRSQAALIGNRSALQQRPAVLAVAHQLLEFVEAHLRADGYHLLIANIRGESEAAIAARMFAETSLGGLQGPTISRVAGRDPQAGMFAVQIVVARERIGAAVNELRAIGGSGVVVSPVTYIFEEEPARFAALQRALAGRA